MSASVDADDADDPTRGSGNEHFIRRKHVRAGRAPTELFASNATAKPVASSHRPLTATTVPGLHDEEDASVAPITSPRLILKQRFEATMLKCVPFRMNDMKLVQRAVPVCGVFRIKFERRN